MRQVIKHKDIRLLNMIRRTDPVIPSTEIARQRQTKGMKESRDAAQAGGRIAKNTRDDLERQLGRTVISSERASDYIKPIESQDADALPIPDEEK